MRRAFLLNFCVLIVLSSQTWADSTPAYTSGVDGCTVVPIRNDKISMVREVVNIDCRWTTYTVRADFWFRNTTDQVQVVKMGFPVDCWKDPKLPDYINSFRVRWKGRTIAYVLAPFRQADEKHPWGRQWITWTARFKPNEEVRHRVSYTFPMDSMGEAHDAGPSASMKYVLKTGALWRGPIDSAVINIHYDHSLSVVEGDEEESDVDARSFPKSSDLRFYPKGYVLNDRGKTVTWTFRDFEPDKDIYFGWGDVPDFAKLDVSSPTTAVPGGSEKP